MPQRRFDKDVMKARRRRRDVTGAHVAEACGVATAQITKWEKGTTIPSADRFPAIARALTSDLDELFPRIGAPNLTDLRCDAELTQAQAGEVIDTTAKPVHAAERARQRLKDEYVPRLARAYNVTEAQLLAAQDRSFGVAAAPAADAAAPTLGARIGQALASAQLELDDAELTERINQSAGRTLLAADTLAALRAGTTVVEEAFGSGEDAAAFEHALGSVLDETSPISMVLKGVRQLTRSDLHLAARGAEEFGLSDAMVDRINSLIVQAEREAAERRASS